MYSTGKSHSGFTVIELLIAILIIILLVGISAVSYRGVMSLFAGVTVKNEMNNLATALEQYKSKFGEYPPDGQDVAISRRHILKRWPQVLKNKGILDAAGMAALVPTEPSKALHFWLCGPWRDGSAKCGFSTDKENPFGLLANGSGFDPQCDSLETPFIDITPDTESDGRHGGNTAMDSGYAFFVYRDLPIVYFRAEKMGYVIPNTDTATNRTIPFIPKQYDYGTTNGYATPYMNSGKWFKPEGYQLIHAGEDGNFGKVSAQEYRENAYHPRDITVDTTLSLEDNDNVVNFIEGAVLQSALQ